MSFNLRLLGVAVLATVALASAGASSAVATEFHCSVEPCRVTVSPDEGPEFTGDQQFYITDSKNDFVGFGCPGVSSEATPSGKTSSTLTLTKVEYTGCENIGVPAPVNMNGCSWVLSAAGSVSITCPKEKKIEWHPFRCRATIGAQGPVGKAIYHNIAKGSEITVEFNLSGIKGTLEFSEGCILAPGEFEGSTPHANTILRGETDNEAATRATLWWE